MSSTAVTPSARRCGRRFRDAGERALGAERPDVQLVDDEILERERRASRGRSSGTRRGSTTSDGPCTPSRLKARGGIGKRAFAVETIAVERPRAGSANEAAERTVGRLRQGLLAAHGTVRVFDHQLDPPALGSPHPEARAVVLQNGAEPGLPPALGRRSPDRSSSSRAWH